MGRLTAFVDESYSVDKRRGKGLYVLTAAIVEPGSRPYGRL